MLQSCRFRRKQTRKGCSHSRSRNRSSSSSHKRSARQLGGQRATATRRVAYKPPRLIILDNDETTGSYWILFKLVHLFRDHNLDTFDIKAFVPAITNFCLKARIFRPGLLDFLNTIAKLRATNKVDAIIMYTYQDELVGRKDDWSEMYNTHGRLVNIPILLDYCFGYMTGGFKEVRPFFDTRIARPAHRQLVGLSETDSLGPKQMSAVFKALRMKPTTDLQYVAFVDDCYLNISNIADKRNKLGPLTGTFIKPYNMTLADVGAAVLELKQLHKTFLHQYVDAGTFQHLIDAIEHYELDKYAVHSDCRSKDPFTYDLVDLTQLGAKMRKLYKTM